MSDPLKAYEAKPYRYAEARLLVDELGVSEPVAITLVRRGHRTPDQARSFLAAVESHDPSEFRSMAKVVERVRNAIENGRRITVHGDFDVDGVCSTTILVSTLRNLGAVCDWLIPDRIGDGYGLGSANVKRLAERGTGLLITVDCGITAVDEVREAVGLGIDVVVTDHHQPKDELPDCLILHPVIDGYPFADLCGTAVAWKLSSALRATSGDPAAADTDLDLVALATVADLVPLVGENRSLVKLGLDALRRTRRPGLLALARVAGVNLDAVGEKDLGFRLGPRVNAVGRLYRADAGVELFLTEDPERAAAIAEELDSANRERQFTERDVEAAAEKAFRVLTPAEQEAPAVVVAGAGWHPGVVGIAASRLAEAHWAPTVVISIGEDGSARGSGRSIPGFDLLAALEACSEHLVSFGGHRAAAGLELRADSIAAFRAAFINHACEFFGTDPRTRTEQVDAVVGGTSMGLELAEQIGELGPFGMGNPGVRLLVPSARVTDVKTMGEGKHSRFSLQSGAHRAVGVAFGRSGLPVNDDDSVDIAFRLEVNEWRGSVEPRIVLREIYNLESQVAEGCDAPKHRCECGDGEWWERAGRAATISEESPTGVASSVLPGGQTAVGAAQVRIEAHRGSPSATVAEVVSTGEPVLAVVSDASRRAGLALGAAGLSRFAGGSASIACSRCGVEAINSVLEARDGHLAMVDYAALELAEDRGVGFGHVVLVDPPSSSGELELAEAQTGNGGYVHASWGGPEQRFALQVLADRFDLRPRLGEMYRALRTTGEVSGAALDVLLRGAGPHLRSPETAGALVGVLSELGLVEGAGWADQARTLGAVSSEGTDLEQSAIFRAAEARLGKGRKWLERNRHQQPPQA